MSWEVNREKRKRMRDDGKRKEKKRGFKPPIFNYSFFYWNSQQEPLWGREGYPSHRSQHGHHASCQGRSQEETATEANTRSVVRNQPYEIF